MGENRACQLKTKAEVNAAHRASHSRQPTRQAPAASPSWPGREIRRMAARAPAADTAACRHSVDYPGSADNAHRHPVHGSARTAALQHVAMRA